MNETPMNDNAQAGEKSLSDFTSEAFRQQLAAVTKERDVLEIKEAALFGLYEKASRELAAANLALDGMSRAALENAERLAVVTRERDESRAREAALREAITLTIKNCQEDVDDWQKRPSARAAIVGGIAGTRDILKAALNQPAPPVMPVEDAEALADGIEIALKGTLADAPEWEVTEALHSTLAAHRAKHPRTKQPPPTLIHYTTEAFTTEDDPHVPRATACGLSLSPASGLITRNRANVTCTQCQP